jgi:hypothetical protein
LLSLKRSKLAISTRALGHALALAAAASSAHAASLIPQETSIGLDTVGYFHASDEAPKGFQSPLAPQLIGKWNTHRQGAWAEAGIQSDLLLMFSDASQGSASPSPYFEVPEIYLGTSRELAPVQLEAGRKLETWNHLDEQWSLGIWQPRFRWDYLHPETVGLTGVFLRVEQPLFRIVAWGSPISVPERGVPISTENGAFASDSRWFIPPPSTGQLFGQDTPLRYSLMMPELGNLLLNPGASVMARVGREKGAWGSVGYAYKPMNQLLLGETSILHLGSTPAAIHGDAQISPRVTYHQLVSAEGGYESEPVNFWVSALGEHPFRDTTPSTWTTQEVAPALALSSTVDVRIAGSASRATRMDLSVLRQWGGNAGDQGPDAAGGTASNFEARYPFQQAVSMGLRSPLPVLSRVSASSHVLYDIGHDGAIWSTEVRYQARDNWILGVGADLLSASQSEDPQNADLIARYRANDRVHAGVTYVF